MRNRILGIGFAALIACAGVADAKTIKVFNSTRFAIVAVQTKAPAAKDWSTDHLGNSSLGVGKVAKMELDATPPNCQQDLRATFDNGNKVEMPKFDLCRNDVVEFPEK